jgi:hypothetical protein
MTWTELEGLALAHYFDTCWVSDEARRRAVKAARERQARRRVYKIEDLLDQFSYKEKKAA